MSYSDLEVDLTGTNGLVATVMVSNPQSHAETARVQIGLSLMTGAKVTLTSPNFTVAAGDSKQVQILAAAPIETVTDDPVPVPSN